MLKFSIVTPSFNQGHFIEETILSVLNQDYPNQEYIIIDGGSTDNTAEIIKRYESRLTYWVSEKDKGQSHAINKGFEIATGDIVCWLNSDDLFTRNSLRTVGEYFTRNDKTEMLCGDVIYINDRSEILRPFYSLKPKKSYAQSGVYYIAQQGMFWRRDIFDKLGGMINEDYHMCMDKEFLLRCYENKINIKKINAFLGMFRRYEDAKTGNMNPRWEQENEWLKDIYKNKYKIGSTKTGIMKYRMEKFIRGFYFKEYFFNRAYKGKPVSFLNSPLS